MPTTKFYLDTRRSDAGKCSNLKIALTHKRKVSYISLDIKIMGSQWDFRKERIVNHPDAFLLNNHINGIKRDVDSAIIRLMTECDLNKLSVSDIKTRVDRIIHPENFRNETDESLFVPRFKAFIEHKKPSTKETYEHTLKRIKAFRPDEYSTLRFEDQLFITIHLPDLRLP